MARQSEATVVDLELATVLSGFARTMLADLPLQGIPGEPADRVGEVVPVSGAAVTIGRPIGNRSDDSGCGGGPVVLPALGYAPATLEDGTPVPSRELGVVMCDCELPRIVKDAAGVPLDLGRTERLFTGPQRKAVIARDRECAWPHCHAHARWCHIHHLT